MLDYMHSLATPCLFFFFFNDPAPTEIYPLSLPAALPISGHPATPQRYSPRASARATKGESLDLDPRSSLFVAAHPRSEEHTSELQSHLNLVCRLLLEKKKRITLDGSSRARVQLGNSRCVAACRPADAGLHALPRHTVSLLFFF